jgi:hypothetical protein
VTDNGSRDGTREILEQHHRDGLVTEIIDEPNHVYDQPRFVDRMIRRARDYYAADFCINSDADEFWYPASGSLRGELSHTRTSKICCSAFYMLPAPAQDFWNATDRCMKRADPDKFAITEYYNLFVKPIPKTIHRAQGYKMIEMGNHGVEMDDDFPLPGSSLNRLRSSLRYRYTPRSTHIWIYHYSLRTVEQFKKKIIQGGAALEANKNSTQSQGPHWRYLYRRYMANTLDFEEEFYKVTGAAQIERFRKEGIVVSDATMKHIFFNVPKWVSFEKTANAF